MFNGNQFSIYVNMYVIKMNWGLKLSGSSLHKCSAYAELSRFRIFVPFLV